MGCKRATFDSQPLTGHFWMAAMPGSRTVMKEVTRYSACCGIDTNESYLTEQFDDVYACTEDHSGPSVGAL